MQKYKDSLLVNFNKSSFRYQNWRISTLEEPNDVYLYRLLRET